MAEGGTKAMHATGIVRIAQLEADIERCVALLAGGGLLRMLGDDLALD